MPYMFIGDRIGGIIMTVSQDVLEKYIEDNISWTDEQHLIKEIERDPHNAEDKPKQILEEFWREERATHKRRDGKIDRRTDKVKWFYEKNPERAESLLKKHYSEAYEKIDDIKYEAEVFSFKPEYKGGRPSKEITVLFENLYGKIEEADSLYELSQVHAENIPIKGKREILEKLQAKRFKLLSKKK